MRGPSNKKNNQTPPNCNTLDSFMLGLPFRNSNSDNSSSSRAPHFTSRIKVPRNLGPSPLLKPIESPFLYPEYPQFREYQYDIAIKCITENVLACLPTGLGKTHIASVTMLNFHVWFPEGLIFFLAPTKPLVDQQSKCLANFSQYVKRDKVFSLTGSVAVQKRIHAYKQKKVFFCTPQTLENDLLQNRLDPRKIVLIVFDQAHKSVGNYSYANIAKFMQNFAYRILALSATPGNEHIKIQQVILNLQISKMIVKSDDDPDVKKYIKNKQQKPIVIERTKIIRQVQTIMGVFISWPIKQLLKWKLIDPYLSGGKYGFNPKCFFIIREQIISRVNQLPFPLRNKAFQGMLFLKYLADCLSMLRQSGYQSFKGKFIYDLQSLDSFGGGQKNMMKVLTQHENYKKIKQLFSGPSKADSHPKLQKLKQLLTQFFSSEQNIKKKSKVIIFANYRCTCHQIHKYLQSTDLNKIIKSQIFLGQAKTTVQTRESQKSQSITQTLQLTQKQQIDLIRRYKANQLNTLISTSIGEQGLDIGQVDAIFCYDGGMSTIRMIQRMGRTGRKRDGTVYVLLMEGKEEDQYNRANKKKQKMKKNDNTKYKYSVNYSVMFEEIQFIDIKRFEKPTEVEEQPHSEQKVQKLERKHIQKRKQSKESDESSKQKSCQKKGKSTKKKTNGNKNKSHDTRNTKKKALDKIQQILQAPKSQETQKQEEQKVKKSSLLQKYLLRKKNQSQQSSKICLITKDKKNQLNFDDVYEEKNEQAEQLNNLNLSNNENTNTNLNSENQFEIQQQFKQQFSNGVFNRLIQQPNYDKFSELFSLVRISDDDEQQNKTNENLQIIARAEMQLNAPENNQKQDTQKTICPQSEIQQREQDEDQQILAAIMQTSNKSKYQLGNKIGNSSKSQVKKTNNNQNSRNKNNN